jgi:hypothetical protein
MIHQSCGVLQMDGLQASTLIQQMYAPDDRPRIIAVSADTLQVCCHHPLHVRDRCRDFWLLRFREDLHVQA